MWTPQGNNNRRKQSAPLALVLPWNSETLELSGGLENVTSDNCNVLRVSVKCFYVCVTLCERLSQKLLERHLLDGHSVSKWCQRFYETLLDGVCRQGPPGGECRAMVPSTGPPGGAVEVDLLQGRGAGQADAPGWRRPHSAAAAELLHGAFCNFPSAIRSFSFELV